MWGFTRVLLSISTTILWFRHATCFTIGPSTAARNHRPTHRVGRTRAPFFNERRCSLASCGRSSASGGGNAALVGLRISDEDRERDLKFEKDLDRDAQLWINGDPEKQKLWDKAKSWRNLNKMILARQEAMSELEKDRLRYLLKDVQTVTGLPLLDGKEITPLAWAITLTIQLMPLAAMYIIVSTLALEHNPQPVLDASKPFWA